MNRTWPNARQKVREQADALIARGFVVAATNGTLPVVAWRGLTSNPPDQGAIHDHYAAIAMGKADAVALITGHRNLVCIAVIDCGEAVDEFFVDDITVRLRRPYVDDDPWVWRAPTRLGWHIWLTVPDLPRDVGVLFGVRAHPTVRQVEVRGYGEYTIIAPTVSVPAGVPPTAPWADVERAVGGFREFRGPDPRRT